MIDGLPAKVDVIFIEHKEIYDDMGFPISDPLIEEGYDLMGFPVGRVIGVIQQ